MLIANEYLSPRLLGCITPARSGIQKRTGVKTASMAGLGKISH